MSLVEIAPAKLNLALHVRHRRPDGYHELETLFAFTLDGDSIGVAPGDDLRLCIVGPMADGLSATDNLVISAARILAKAAGVTPRGHLILTKNLPVASGIGGGSADAAATLRLLNRFWGINYSREQLAVLAESLGADVPACVHSRTMMGTGKGEQLLALDLPMELAGKPVLLVNPMVALATGQVFAAWDGIDRGPLMADASPAGLTHARNDLETGAVRLCPAIAQTLAALSGHPDSVLSRMSGSGATCFAIFENDAALVAARQKIEAAYPGWWLLSTSLNQF